MPKLKGHTEIILTDVNTGEVTRQESDNMFTNAIQNAINTELAWGSIDRLNTCILPLYTKGLRGIYLFQNELTEDVNNWHMPAPNVNPVIGYAGDDAYTGTDLKRGSLNEAECEELDNGYKFVWDFTTSQANGTMSAVSLTNYYVITAGIYGNAQSTGNINISLGWSHDNFFLIGLTNDYIIQIINYNNSNLSYEEWTINVKRADLMHSHRSYNRTKYVDLTIDWDGTVSSYSSTTLAFTIGDDGYIYGMARMSDATAHLIRLNATTLEQDTSFGVKTISSYCSGNYTGLCVIDNYAYYVYRTDKILVKVNLDDTTDITTKSISVNPNALFMDNGFINAFGCDYVYDTDLNEYYSRKMYAGYTGENPKGVANDSSIIKIDYSYSGKTRYLTVEPRTPYLATINNITPVTKTAAQTMKVVYTVTETE